MAKSSKSEREEDEEREERKEKKSKKEKKQAKAAQASTPQRPSHNKDEALTIHRSPLKKVQIDDKRFDRRKIDDYRIERQSDLAVSAPSGPARLLQT